VGGGGGVLGVFGLVGGLVFLGLPEQRKGGLLKRKRGAPLSGIFHIPGTDGDGTQRS